MIDEEQLKLEIQHIFDSGANEIRIYEMVKNFILSSRHYDKIKELKAENELLSNRLKGFKLHYQVDENNKLINDADKLCDLILLHIDSKLRFDSIIEPNINEVGVFAFDLKKKLN